MTTDVATLKAIGRAAGLDAIGVAVADPFVTTRRDLEARRAAGLHGGMNFTYRNPERSTDPARALAGARSIVVGARSYRAPARSSVGARVAAYANDDHYGALRTALEAVADALRDDGWEARVVVDDNALVDREAAYRAGIGWYGKSSNVLLPGRGSWFVLGSVLTTAALAVDDAPVGDGCGPCRRCIDGCPTGAIVAPGVVDARRCLAWLLQAEGDFPIEFRAALGDRIYGCDECQEVCPPNRRARRTDETSEAGVDVVELLASDDETLLARHGRWYVPARDPRYLRRNALVVLGNTGDAGDGATVAILDRYAHDPDPMLRSHAAWAVDRITSRG
ncbi:MAG TPA: tRNA epoxyqueuosine(34) reductase QueG [Acidimicrobiales bacterium]|nr:tRNA epoxyqueuosine(34) reductase QueG [Acidimicrobiales bacterium]